MFYLLVKIIEEKKLLLKLQHINYNKNTNYISKIFLEVADNNIKAINFYENNFVFLILDIITINIIMSTSTLNAFTKKIKYE